MKRHFRLGALVIVLSASIAGVDQSAHAGEGPVAAKSPIAAGSFSPTSPTRGAAVSSRVSAKAAAASVPPPGPATVVQNPYGSLSVQGVTLAGNALSGWQANAVLQLGNVVGNGADFLRIDFQGLNVPTGYRLTIRSGASAQSVQLYNADATATGIEGTIAIEGGGGAPPPTVSLQNPNGITVAVGGRIQTAGSLSVVALGSTWTVGNVLVNDGTIDGGERLRLHAARITGAGSYKGNNIEVASFGHVNSPRSGNRFLANSLQLAPSSGAGVVLSLGHYGATSPQVFNLKVNGNATVSMPSAFPAPYTPPLNTLPTLPAQTRPAGAPNPAYGPSSVIVQATGNLTLTGGGNGDFVIAGGVVLKSGGTLDLNGVFIVNGWTLAGQPFQGVYFEAPVITSTGSDIRVYTNNLNWVNFSTFPRVPVRTWQLLQQPDGSARYIAADAMAPHLNTYSVLVEAAANGECWVCLVHTGIVDMHSPAEARRDASRLMRQATFGATREAIDAALNMGTAAWLDDQFAKPATSHFATAKADPINVANPFAAAFQSIWKQFFTAEDQLRQRMGFALSQIYVVSSVNSNVVQAPCGSPSYLDMLNRNAFGNVRTLLRDVTLHPIMGEFLSMKQSAKADPILQTQPDENYPREVMQLFSVGLVMLNVDGTTVLDGNGKPIPTFNEDTVKGFAKALSGWTFAGQNQTQPWRWMYPDIWDPDRAILTAKACPAWATPMEPWRTKYRSADDTRDIAGPAHDMDAKQLLIYPGAPYATLPANQAPETDLENLIDNVFYHPNFGPFLGKQLIQRLVTSNPTPQYVQRVALAFNDNGAGVRGDLKAVLRAILLDSEARSLAVAAGPQFGKLSEPVVRFVQMHRAFNAKRPSGYWDLPPVFHQPTFLNQSPLWAPSVFNFYHPDFAPAGPLSSSQLVGPEFEITTTTSIPGYSEFSKEYMIPGYYGNAPDINLQIIPDHTYYLSLAATPGALVDELDHVLAAGGMNPAVKVQIVQSIAKIDGSNSSNPDKDRLYQALWLIINSPDYLVQK